MSNGRDNPLLVYLHRTLGDLKERKAALDNQFPHAKLQRALTEGERMRNNLKWDEMNTVPWSKKQKSPKARRQLGDSTTITILQVADIHLDRYYAEVSA